jgi:thioredoxin-related protein
MKKRAFLLLYGFVLITIWGICFLGRGMSDSYTAAMGLSFTFISAYFLQKEFDFKLDLRDKIAVSIFPVLYIVAVYFVLFNNNQFSLKKYNLYQLLFYFHLINPLNVAYASLLLSLTALKNVAPPRNIFIFVYITLFYAYFFHTPWLALWLGTQARNFNAEMSDTKQQSSIPDSINIAGFSFINSNHDTLALKNQAGKFILLETWSENCLPCIRAMNELPDFYWSIQDEVDVYYVYENNKARVRSQFDKIFNFESIQEKSDILIDINQELYYALDMQGYPYFVLFDPKGRLIHQVRGYPGKEKITKELLRYIRQESPQ